MSSTITPAQDVIDKLVRYDNSNNIATWNPVSGQAVSLNYSFIYSLPNYWNNIPAPFDMNTVNWFSIAQMLAAEGAMNAWSSFANITFTNAGDNNQNATITFGNIKFLVSDDNLGVTDGDLSQDKSRQTLADIWINNSIRCANFN